MYVEKVDEITIRGSRRKARTRCILANGTETNILDDSLAKSLYEDGQVVSPLIDAPTELDAATGCVYVLCSLSKEPQLKAYKSLRKIGFSTTSAPRRIANAENETTYLMAKVRLLDEYKTFNSPPEAFERILHTFFNEARANIHVYDHQGIKHCVTEWFDVPDKAIEQAVDYIRASTLNNYRYDADLRQIVPND